MEMFRKAYASILCEQAMDDSLGEIAWKAVFDPFVSRNGIEYIPGKLYWSSGLPQFGQYLIFGDNDQAALVRYCFPSMMTSGREGLHGNDDITPMEEPVGKIDGFYRLMLPGIRERHKWFMETGMFKRLWITQHQLSRDLRHVWSGLTSSTDFFHHVSGVSVKVGYADSDVIWISICAEPRLFPGPGMKSDGDGFIRLLQDAGLDEEAEMCGKCRGCVGDGGFGMLFIF